MAHSNSNEIQIIIKIREYLYFSRNLIILRSIQFKTNEKNKKTIFPWMISFFSYAYAIAQFCEILKKIQIFCRMKVFSEKITPIANVCVEFSEMIKPINSLINSCMQISWEFYQMLFTRNSSQITVHSSQIRILIRFFRKIFTVSPL